MTSQTQPIRASIVQQEQPERPTLQMLVRATPDADGNYIAEHARPIGSGFIILPGWLFVEIPGTRAIALAQEKKKAMEELGKVIESVLLDDRQDEWWVDLADAARKAGVLPPEKCPTRHYPDAPSHSEIIDDL